MYKQNGDDKVELVLYPPEPNPTSITTQREYQNIMSKIKIKKTLNSLAFDWGRRGGKALVKKRGKAYMKRIGKVGAKKRWSKEL